MKRVYIVVCLSVFMLVSMTPAFTYGGQVSGQVVIPASDMGWEPSLFGMKVRVEGTDIQSEVDQSTGEFTLSDVPEGMITLLLVEDSQDAFTQSSKRAEVEVGVVPITGVSFDLVYHWQELGGYPSQWGETGYGEWSAHFVSDQTGFILFRVRGEGIDPERVELYRTLDSGTTWEEIGHWLYGAPTYPSFVNRIFYFSDQNHGVVEAMIDTNPDPDVVWYSIQGVLYTADGGTTWSYKDFPNPSDPDASGVIGIHLFTQIDAAHWIAAGQNAGTGSYGLPNFDVIWETTDYGENWAISTYWQQDNGACTGLGANTDGKAIAFFTPYDASERRRALRDMSGTWTVTSDDSIVTNSGYGPADVPMVSDTAWVSNSNQASQDAGLYQSQDAGLNWIKISDALLQYMDFASENKGFALAGGPAYVSYDGGITWLYQSGGGGLCCGGNQIWAFDTIHTTWQEGGAGDPNGESQLFSYNEPWEANFEVIPGISLKDSYVESGDAEVPVGSYTFFNHGPVPIVVEKLSLRAAGVGNLQCGVSVVGLWQDQNANGYADGEDTLLDSGTYDDGIVELSCGNLVLEQYVPVHVLVTYDFVENLFSDLIYSCTLQAEDIVAKTQDTQTDIIPTAPPAYLLPGRQLTPGKTVFEDDFEAGLTNWTTDELDAPWAITDTDYISPNHSAYSFATRDDNNYGSENNLTLKVALDFSEDNEYALTFNHRYYFEPLIYGDVEISTDGGATWVDLVRYGDSSSGENTGGEFVNEVLDLTAYATEPEVLIRFQVDWTSTWYYNPEWFIDDVSVLINVSTALLGDEVAFDFGTNGLWHYNGTNWTSLTGWNPDGKMEEWAGGLAVDFGTYGLWNYDGSSWTWLAGWDPDDIEKYDTGLAVDFGTNGLWHYDGTDWTSLAVWNPDGNMEEWAGGLAVDFGTNGLWNYNGFLWTSLAGWDTYHIEKYCTGLAVDFGTYGLWRYDGSGWTNLSSWDPEGMRIWESGLAVDFGLNGLWNYDGSLWTNLASWDPDVIEAYGIGIAVDFNTYGLWYYDSSSWTSLAGWNPDGNIVEWTNGLAVDFGASYGLWNYDGSSWTNLAGWDPEEIINVDLY